MEKLLNGQNEKNARKLSNISAIKSKDDLRTLFNESEKQKKPIYYTLTEKGYIKNPLDEFYGVM